MDLSRRQLLALAGISGATTLLGATPSASGAVRQVAPRPRFAGDPGLGRVYYGSTMPYYKDMAAWESWLGRPLAAHRHYHQAGEIRELVTECASDLNAGRMPHASIKPPGTWKSVATGAQDSWLKALLDETGALDRPVFLTLHHEPENDSGPVEMSPRDWVAMQERAIKKAAVRAPKVTIVPVLMGWTFDAKSGRQPASWMVPSARVLGFDTYNAWSPTNGKAWSTFAEKVEKVRPYANGRPMVVGEYGCREDARDPERAVRWMRNAFEYAIAHDIICMSYFNSQQNSPDGTWELDGRRAEVFRELLGRSEVARP